MARTSTHKTQKRQAGTAGRTSGRIQVRRETADYRATARDPATQAREVIDTALADARRMREEIEARIETRWHSPSVSRAATGAKGGRRRRAKA